MMSVFKNASDAGHNRGEKTNHNNLQTQYSTGPLGLVLSGLENVRPAGEGYRADCPNGHRSHGSLAVKVCENGSVLIHCHSGCGPLDVLHGLGLELSDLYERPIERPKSPQHRRELQEKIKIRRWKVARKDIEVEINVLLLAAGQAYRKEPISDTDMDRMILAGKRLRSALGEL